MGEVVKIEEAIAAFNNQAVTRTASIVRRIGALLGLSPDGDRNLYDVYKYPQSLGGEEGFKLLYRYAHRHGIANRITYGMARSCWRDGFELRADEDDAESVQLEEPLQLLRQNGLVRKLERADVLNRIGRFSVLYVGVPDGHEPWEPLGRSAPGRLGEVYFVPYAYDNVEPLTYDNDPMSPRFGLPEIYQLRRVTRESDEKDRSRMSSIRVHYSRLVHMAENLLDSEIEGAGALEPVFNRILDLDKACGGSAEAYFRNARRIIGYEVDKDFAPQLLSDTAARERFDEGVRQFTDGWQDHAIAAGAKMSALSAPHHSPMDTVKVALYEISSFTGIPIRVLIGEGSGQLAGSEDQLAYNHLVSDRQKLFCSAQVHAVMSILSAAGMLQYDPQWRIYFPPQEASTEAQRAEVDANRALTLQRVLQGLSTPAGDAVDMQSTLDAMGLSDIQAEERDELPPEGE